jgi:NADH-quinone oxidoreductase subunit C
MTPAAPAPSPKPPPAPAVEDPVTVLALSKIRARFPDAVVESVTSGRHPFLRVGVERLRDVCLLVRDDTDLRMDCCHLLSGVDWPAKKPGEKAEMEVLYHLVSYERRPDPVYRSRDPRKNEKNDAWLCLKVRVPREKPEVPSVMDLWTGADWHERETWDLFGIRFTGRAELPRILLPEDWPGHPMRKDWEYPADYHGVPIVPPEEQELP